MAEETTEKTPATETTEKTETSQATGLLADAKKSDETKTPDPEKQETTDPTKTPETEIAERPPEIDEQFWDVEKGVVKGAVLGKSYKDLRKEFDKLVQNKGEKAPEKAEDYLTEYKPPHRSRPTGDQKEGDTLDRYGELKADDPVFIGLSKAAKGADMSQAQFNDFIQVALEELHPILPEPFNAEKEKALLGEGAENMITTNRDWLDTLARNGVLNEDEFKLLLAFGGTALGVQLTNKLRLNSGEKPIPIKLNGNANTGRKTPDECQAMMADDRYYADGAAGDAYRKEVDAAFALTHGTDPA